MKLKIYCLNEEGIGEIINVSKTVSEIANMTHEKSYSYVGASAFAHKGGMHIDGVSTNIIEAIWKALLDSIEYFLYREVERN